MDSRPVRGGANSWNSVFESRTEAERSWSQPLPQPSLDLIRAVTTTDASVVDVGGGSSRLVDHLLASGYHDITVLDVAAAALAEAAARLPSDAPIHWVVTDLLQWHPPRQYTVWHDRAVFHFVVDEAQQRRYVEIATQAVRPGGHLVVATFAPGGPEQCSGLPVQQWSAESLGDRFAGAFELEWNDTIMHTTPSGGAQPFTWAMLRRSTAPG